jgi:hypothetical protein
MKRLILLATLITVAPAGAQTGGAVRAVVLHESTSTEMRAYLGKKVVTPSGDLREKLLAAMDESERQVVVKTRADQYTMFLDDQTFKKWRAMLRSGKAISAPLRNKLRDSLNNALGTPQFDRLGTPDQYGRPKEVY